MRALRVFGAGTYFKLTSAFRIATSNLPQRSALQLQTYFSVPRSKFQVPLHSVPVPGFGDGGRVGDGGGVERIDGIVGRGGVF